VQFGETATPVIDSAGVAATASMQEATQSLMESTPSGQQGQWSSPPIGMS
jgi:hypothetical protein